MSFSFAGKGNKRTQLNLTIDRINLNSNPVRFPDFSFTDESAAIKHYLGYSNLQGMIESLATHGYFDEEPIVAVPARLPERLLNLSEEEMMWNEEYVLHIHDPQNKFMVVEGNRRIAAIKAILDADKYLQQPDNSTEGNDCSPELAVAQYINDIPDSVIEDLTIIPSIIYTSVEEVLPYLAVRHSNLTEAWGKPQWDSFGARMKEQGFNDDYIELFSHKNTR